jgi:hypothetical protein
MCMPNNMACMRSNKRMQARVAGASRHTQVRATGRDRQQQQARAVGGAGSSSMRIRQAGTGVRTGLGSGG